MRCGQRLFLDHEAWVQAIIWRYKAGLLADPATACAEELLCVYNNLEHTSYSSIDDLLDGMSFRDRAQYILDLGEQGVWGECTVHEYTYTGASTSYHQAQGCAGHYDREPGRHP
mgnify:CR=1 FL=1